MCAMLVLIAPEELGVSRRRVNRFIDAYIGGSVFFLTFGLFCSSVFLFLFLELLTRRRLDVCAAYLRKFCRVEDVSHATLVKLI